MPKLAANAGPIQVIPVYDVRRLSHGQLGDQLLRLLHVDPCVLLPVCDEDRPIQIVDDVDGGALQIGLSVLRGMAHHSFQVVDPTTVALCPRREDVAVPVLGDATCEWVVGVDQRGERHIAPVTRPEDPDAVVVDPVETL